MRPSVLGTRPEKRLLERSSVCSLGSAPRDVVVLQQPEKQRARNASAERLASFTQEPHKTDGWIDRFVALG
jgi:hypothetical protein